MTSDKDERGLEALRVLNPETSGAIARIYVMDAGRPDICLAHMHQFTKSTERWWQKPLVLLGTNHIPAELAVLQTELQPGEGGAWLNSRGVVSGTAELTRDAGGKFKTRRVELPIFVSARLRELYELAGLSKGAPDLVIWNARDSSLRFVEVKCPHWDTPSGEQLRFLEAAEAAGVPVAIVEWEFCET